MRGISELFESDDEAVVFDLEATNLLRITTPLPTTATPLDVAYALLSLASKYSHLAAYQHVLAPTPELPITIATHMFENVDEDGPIILPVLLEVKRPDEGDVETLQALSGAWRRKHALDEAGE